MAIRIDLEFAAPIEPDARCRLLLAMAALPEVRRCVVSPDRRRATAYGAEVSLERVRAALAEADVAAIRVASGLVPEVDAALGAPPGERFRPIGR